jgi:hypothetical protein
MRTLFDVLIVLALVAVAVTLAFGIYSLQRGGEFSLKYSNKIMRLRILLQFVAILILAGALIWKHYAH